MRLLGINFGWEGKPSGLYGLNDTDRNIRLAIAFVLKALAKEALTR